MPRGIQALIESEIDGLKAAYRARTGEEAQVSLCYDRWDHQSRPSLTLIVRSKPAIPGSPAAPAPVVVTEGSFHPTDAVPSIDAAFILAHLNIGNLRTLADENADLGIIAPTALQHQAAAE